MAIQRFPRMFSNFVALLTLIAIGTASADMDADYHRGLQAMEKGQHQEAIIIFQAIASSNSPMASSAHLQIAKCYRATAKSLAAVEQFKQGIQLATSRNEQDALIQLVTGLADTYVNLNMFDDALKLCQIPEQMVPERREFIIARIYLMKREFDKAVDTLNGLLIKYPASSNLLEYKIVYAECLASLSRFDDACKNILELIKDYPSSQLTSGKDGKVLAGVLRQIASGGSPQNATSLSDELLAVVADNTTVMAPGLRSAVVFILAKAWRIDDGARLLQQAKSTAKNQQEILNTLLMLGAVFMDATRYAEAASTYEEAYLLTSASATEKARAKYNAGCCYRLAGQNDKAETCMQAVIQQHSATDAAKEAQTRLKMWTDSK